MKDTQIVALIQEVNKIKGTQIVAIIATVGILTIIIYYLALIISAG